MCDEGFKKDGVTVKRKLRERPKAGTGASLRADIADQLTDYLIHQHACKFQYHTIEDVKTKAFVMHADYAAIYGIDGKLNPMSFGISPKEISMFVCVIDREYDEAFEDDSCQPPLDDGRVHEVVIVISDYNQEEAQARQDSSQTEGCMRTIIIDQYKKRGYTKFGNAIVFVTDRCAAQFRCATKFGMQDSWTSPGMQPGLSAVDVARMPDGHRAECQRILDEKRSLGLVRFVHLYGTQYHGKYEGDGHGGDAGTVLTMTNLSVADGTDAPELYVVDAFTAVTALRKVRGTGLKGAKSSVPSRRARGVTSSITYIHRTEQLPTFASTRG